MLESLILANIKFELVLIIFLIKVQKVLINLVMRHVDRMNTSIALTPQTPLAFREILVLVILMIHHMVEGVFL
jgi:hypothetical protein